MNAGPHLNIKPSYLRMAISMLKIRRPLGRLIFNMGIAIPGKTVFLIETAPRWLHCQYFLHVCHCDAREYISNWPTIEPINQLASITHVKSTMRSWYFSGSYVPFVDSKSHWSSISCVSVLCAKLHYNIVMDCKSHNSIVCHLNRIHMSGPEAIYCWDIYIYI